MKNLKLSKIECLNSDGSVTTESGHVLDAELDHEGHFVRGGICLRVYLQKGTTIGFKYLPTLPSESGFPQSHNAGGEKE